MKLVADEGVDRQIVERLRDEGHTVLFVAEFEPGLPDDGVLALANREAAILLTADKDFGELVFRLRRVIAGVLLIRLAGLTPDSKAEIVASTVGERGAELTSAFAVVTPGTVRIRRQFP